MVFFVVILINQIKDNSDLRSNIQKMEGFKTSFPGRRILLEPSLGSQTGGQGGQGDRYCGYLQGSELKGN